MTLANIYLDTDPNTKFEMLNEASFSQMNGANEFGTYQIAIYTFKDGSSIAYLGDYEADLLESVLNEIQ